jgi:hypothetical protein
MNSSLCRTKNAVYFRVHFPAQLAYGKNDEGGQSMRGLVAHLGIALVLTSLSATAANQKKHQHQPSDVRRDDAIASLRAVRSALSAGANLDDFRKYQIESRIKVDALPSIPKNGAIREISDIFTDALAFSVARVTGEISAVEIQQAKTRYANMTFSDKQEEQQTLATQFKEFLSRMTPEERVILMGVDRMGQENRRYAHQTNAIGAGAIAQMLILSANMKLATLK